MDAQCGDGVCAMGTCLPRSTSRVLAVEISPRAGSTAATTEIVGVTVGSDQVALLAEPRVTVEGVAIDQDGNVYAPAGHIVLTVPSVIPGRGVR